MARYNKKEKIEDRKDAYYGTTRTPEESAFSKRLGVIIETNMHKAVANGLCQKLEDVAAKLPVRYTTLMRWRIGLSTPNIVQALKLCFILGVTPNELIGPAENTDVPIQTYDGNYPAKSEIDPNLDVLVNKCLTLPKKDQEELLFKMYRKAIKIKTGIDLEEDVTDVTELASLLNVRIIDFSSINLALLLNDVKEFDKLAKEAVGKVLRDIRTTNVYTVDQLAGEFNAPGIKLSWMESGKGNGNLYFLTQICRRFKVSYDDLYFFNKNRGETYKVMFEVLFSSLNGVAAKEIIEEMTQKGLESLPEFPDTTEPFSVPTLWKKVEGFKRVSKNRKPYRPRTSKSTKSEVQITLIKNDNPTVSD